MSQLPSLPGLATYRELVGRFPEPLRHLGAFTEALLYGPSPFGLGERELIAAHVSSVNHCEYCVRSHVAAARAHGLDSGSVESVTSETRDSAQTGRLSPVLRLTRSVAEGQSTTAAMEEMLQEGWDEAAVVYAVSLAGYWCMINMIVNALNLEGDEDYYARIGPQLARDAREIAARLGSPG